MYIKKRKRYNGGLKIRLACTERFLLRFARLYTEVIETKPRMHRTYETAAVSQTIFILSEGH